MEKIYKVTIKNFNYKGDKDYDKRRKDEQETRSRKDL